MPSQASGGLSSLKGQPSKHKPENKPQLFTLQHHSDDSGDLTHKGIGAPVESFAALDVLCQKSD